MDKNRDYRKMFINEVSSNKKIESDELKKWVLFQAGRIFSHNVTSPKNVEKFKKKIEKNKN